MELSEISTCDLLALITLVTQKFVDCFDADGLDFWGDFLTAVGTNLITIADQENRINAAKTARCSKNNNDNNSENDGATKITPQSKQQKT